MSKTQDAVKKFMESIYIRKSKVQAKVEELTEREAKIHNEIKQLTKKLVELDLCDDAGSQHEINKKLASLRAEQNELLDKIFAYKEVVTDNSINKKEIDEVLDIARAERACRYSEIDRKKEQKERLSKELEKLKRQIESIENEMSHLVTQTEAKSLIPLLPYIEHRKVKHYLQESLLDAVLSGTTGELYEQYIEKTET